MRVFTTVFVACPEQNHQEQDSATFVDDTFYAVELAVELISIFKDRNRTIVIEPTEE